MIEMAQTDVDDISKGLEHLDFHHPYTPYDVQEQFMKTVYNVLETGNGQVGILESPTGTVSGFSCYNGGLHTFTCVEARYCKASR